MAFSLRKQRIFDVWRRKETAGKQLIFSIFGMGACQLSYFWAVQYSNPGTAALTCAFYSIQPKGLLEEFGSLETAGWGMFLGGVFLIPFAKIWEVPGVWGMQTFVLLSERLH